MSRAALLLGGILWLSSWGRPAFGEVPASPEPPKAPAVSPAVAPAPAPPEGLPILKKAKAHPCAADETGLCGSAPVWRVEIKGAVRDLKKKMIAASKKLGWDMMTLDLKTVERCRSRNEQSGFQLEWAIDDAGPDSPGLYYIYYWKNSPAVPLP